ncbi:Hypothetical predicted protein [Paramuricea clavata]|uniref:Uncharacterized protein n=1 Tax=Paramuricea clavata TaxID=317549 RepID=A0A7D9LC93_PARCT|nr:Hypothetical predicted protein [Paramuricea clavata]
MALRKNGVLRVLYVEFGLDLFGKAISKTVPSIGEAPNTVKSKQLKKDLLILVVRLKPKVHLLVLCSLINNILHKKDMIKDQVTTVYMFVYTIEKDRDNFVRERTPKQNVLSTLTLPTFSKCHLNECQNRLNCLYPNHCSPSTFCKNIDKHPERPEGKQTLKDLNKKLSEERKRLSFMKEELKYVTD